MTPDAPPTLHLPGRVLFLADDAQALRRQLHEGWQPTRADALPLRDEVSTDEITPVPTLVHIDERLGDFAHTGFTVQGQCPVAVGALRAGGFSVVVAGARYGKGSSREHSPAAEMHAGIRLVIARSFERIYRQNADNIGLFTSTDFGLVARVLAGEPIPIDDLVAGRDALAAAILHAGGLLRFGQRQLRDVQPAPPVDDGRPRTLFEKIVARHALATPVTAAHPAVGDGAFVRADLRFIHEYYTGMAAHRLQAAFGDGLALHDPASIVVFEDHTSYVEESPNHVAGGLVPAVVRLCRAQRDFAARHGLRQYRTLTEVEAARDDGANVAGISHAMVAEHHARPGQLIAGTDSHTPHSGALGCVAFGVGTTDMANAFVTGAVRMTLPPVLRIEIDGALAPGVTAKDVVLHLLALPALRAGAGLGRVFEFGGPAVRIHIAYGGSCTAGKREDFDHYHAVLAWAAARGLRAAPGVQLFLQFGTTAVRDHCIAQGYLAAFEAVGARILQPSCGACANCGPGSSTRPDQVTVSAINRNFPGRSGPGQVWLASPPTVAASAIAGRLMSFDELRATAG